MDLRIGGGRVVELGKARSERESLVICRLNSSEVGFGLLLLYSPLVVNPRATFSLLQYLTSPTEAPFFDVSDHTEKEK